MIRLTDTDGLADWARGWSGLYVLPQPLTVTIRNNPVRAASEVVVYDEQAARVARTCIPDLALARAFHPRDVRRIVFEAIESVLCIGWDADGREVPA